MIYTSIEYELLSYTISLVRAICVQIMRSVHKQFMVLSVSIDKSTHGWTNEGLNVYNWTSNKQSYIISLSVCREIYRFNIINNSECIMLDWDNKSTYFVNIFKMINNKTLCVPVSDVLRLKLQ